MAAAHYASYRDAQRIWHQLCDLWALWSEHLGQLDPKNNETQVAARNPVIEPAVPRTAKGLKMAERLRLKLALTDVNGARPSGTAAGRPIIEPAVPRIAKALEIADRLRLRLEFTHEMPLYEPDMQISRIRLSDKTSRLHPRHVVPKPAQPYKPEVPNCW
ncbi:MAG: hypothetical protein ABSF87_18910 [Xanthobacteraceae bacterium]